jgi:hypothetical protein
MYFIKNRLIFIIVNTLILLLIGESFIFLIYGEKSKPIVILVELPFFILGSWIYHFAKSTSGDKQKKLD